MSPDRALLQAAMALRGANASVWGEFVEALKARGVELAMASLRAPSEHAQKGQGRALECVELAKMLDNAPAAMDAVKAKELKRERDTAYGTPAW